MVSADMLSLRRLTDYYNYVMTDLRDPRFVNGFCFCSGNFLLSFVSVPLSFGNVVLLLPVEIFWAKLS